MKQKIIGIISIMVLVVAFYLYGDVLTGCKKKERQPQLPAASEPLEPRIPQSPGEPQIPPEPAKIQPPQKPEPTTPAIKEMIIFDNAYGKVAFSHVKHAMIYYCLKCHHNWEVAGRNADLCRSCHGTKAEEGMISSKDAFHKNCKGCHSQEQKGPTGCTKCHVKNPRIQMQQ